MIFQNDFVSFLNEFKFILNPISVVLKIFKTSKKNKSTDVKMKKKNPKKLESLFIYLPPLIFTFRTSSLNKLSGFFHKMFFSDYYVVVPFGS